MIKSAITDISTAEGIALITINGLGSEGQMLSRIFSGIADCGIDVDMITLSPHRKDRMDLSFTVPMEDVSRAVAVIGKVAADKKLMYHISGNNAKITLMSAGVSESVTLTAGIMSILAKADASIRMISASVNEISVLVDEHSIDDALEELNKNIIRGETCDG